MAVVQRIAAGGIVIASDRVLLVRYRNPDDTTYLVGPGGAVDHGEGVFDAVARETREETSLEVQPRRVLFIEDLPSRRFRMCKIWVLCDFLRGEPRITEGAEEEGIVEVGWYNREALADEVVFPPPLIQHPWKSFLAATWQARCLLPRRADF